MSKENIFKGLLDLRNMAVNEAAQAKTSKEQRDFSQVAKVLDSTLFRLGYRRARVVKENTERPSANHFKELKEAKDKEVFADIMEIVNKQKALEDAKKEQVKGLNSGKKQNATKKQLHAIKVMYQEGKTIAEISDLLNLVEEKIYNTLGIDTKDSGVLLADSTND